MRVYVGKANIQGGDGRWESGLSRLDLLCVLYSRCMCPRGGGFQTQALVSPRALCALGSVPHLHPPAPARRPPRTPAAVGAQLQTMPASHTTVPENSPLPLPPTSVKPPYGGQCCIFRTVFCAQASLPGEPEPVESTVVSLTSSGVRAPSTLPRFPVEPSGPVFSKRELIIEKRKSIELGGSPASGHHALSCERTVLAFERTKGV